jgi:hypothetical protein
MKEPELFIDENGTERWKLNGKFHRLDGPAIEFTDGEKHWYMCGKLHRLDGPAVEYPDGEKSWYVDNKFYQTQQEHALAVFLLMNKHERTQ